MNENEGESLLDAINAAIPSEDPPEGDEPEGDEPEGDEPEGDEPEGDEPEGDEPEGDEPEGDEPEGEETEEEAAARIAAAKKPADPINDPLPRGTRAETTERFKHVVDKLKEQTTRADTATAQYDELIGEITGAGMDGTTFGHMLEYARGVNSNTWEGLQSAKAILHRELAGLYKALGEPLPGEDPLQNHPDLAKEVADKLITQARALEIAKQRNRDVAQTKFGQAKQTSQQTAAQQAQAVTQAKQALTALGKELATKDGAAEYRRKAALVVGMLQDTLPDLPPGKWAKAFKAAYEKVPAAPKAAGTANGKKFGAKPQPLRGNKVPSGSSSKQPKSLLEAIGPAFDG